jgi:hypothetical protein
VDEGGSSTPKGLGGGVGLPHGLVGGGRSHPHGPWGWTIHPQGTNLFFFFFIWPLGVAEATPMARPLLFIFVFLIFYYFVFNLFLKINIIKYYYF